MPLISIHFFELHFHYRLSLYLHFTTLTNIPTTHTLSITRFFSMSSSLGEVTKIVLLMSPVKHQNTSASLRTSARMGARMSDMPCVYLCMRG